MWVNLENFLSKIATGLFSCNGTPLSYAIFVWPVNAEATIWQKNLVVSLEKPAKMILTIHPGNVCFGCHFLQNFLPSFFPALTLLCRLKDTFSFHRVFEFWHRVTFIIKSLCREARDPWYFREELTSYKSVGAWMSSVYVASSKNDNWFGKSPAALTLIEGLTFLKYLLD